MARKLRIQYAGARYHIINRGNYRKDLFESVGAAESFLKVLAEATGKFGWKLHAYVLMRNHYHLALETPSPTLVAGMHWMQTTVASRFNRFRNENGHLFQGRYKSILVEDAAALSRVVDYIHLNPVRANVVAPEQVACFRWSSLHRFMKGLRFPGMAPEEWLAARGGWADASQGWREYVAHLVALGKCRDCWADEGLENLSRSWAIGSLGWRRKLAEENRRLVLAPDLERDEVAEIRERIWEVALATGLREAGRTGEDLVSLPRRQEWKVELASRIRAETGAPYGWLSKALNLGKPATLRSYLCRRPPKQQTTA